MPLFALCLLLSSLSSNLQTLRPHTLLDVSQLKLHGEAENIAAAERALARHATAEALNFLLGLASPAAQLVRARAALASGDTLTARVSIAGALTDENLAPWAELERGRLALADGEQMQAAMILAAIWQGTGPLREEAALPLAAAWAIAEPKSLIAQQEELLNAAKKRDVHARGRILGWIAVAYERLSQHDEAFKTLMRRFVEEAASSETPTQPPPGPKPTPIELVTRLEKLVEGHRNRQAEAALKLLDSLAPKETLSQALRCRRAFASGLLARKLHRYRQSESMLSEVLEHCPPGELRQRAAFLQAKVISIQDGVRALGPIEAFLRDYPNGSMVDDVLLWAGDALQRRNRPKEAAAYYTRILNLKAPDDQCAEAAFRLAWMAYEQKDFRAAAEALDKLLHKDCPLERGERARALLWRARNQHKSHQIRAARQSYAALIEQFPLSFYGQVGLGEALGLLAPSERRKKLANKQALVMRGAKVRPLCLGPLAKEPALGRALFLLQRGLLHDASRELFSLVGPLKSEAKGSLEICGPQQSALVLAELLGRADAPKAAQQLLQRHFATALASPPTQKTLAIWRAAYPLAFGADVRRAERESRLPRLLLQALAREESSFDPNVISWAEAYGLTQLLLPSAELASRSLKDGPKGLLADQLSDPALNLRLGAALLRLYLDRLGDSVPLGLAAYNGGLEHARSWADRFADEDVVQFIEQIGIRETRMYVRRVLETWGIYRWLYDGAVPSLPSGERLPKKKSLAKAQKPQSMARPVRSNVRPGGPAHPKLPRKKATTAK